MNNQPENRPKQTNLRPPGWRFFSSPVFPELRVLFFLALAFEIYHLHSTECCHRIFRIAIWIYLRSYKNDYVGLLVLYLLSYTDQWLILQKQPPEVFCKKRCSYFAIFTGKHLCWSLFFIKLQAFRPKKKLQYKCFPMNIAKFLRTPILKNICERLLLFVSYHQPQTLIKVLICRFFCLFIYSFFIYNWQT